MERDLKVKVGAAAGYSACDRPLSIHWQDQELSIREVVREWREPGAKHYLVLVDDNQHFRLIFHENSGEWNILEVKKTRSSA